jgi:hypothetical protein
MNQGYRSPDLLHYSRIVIEWAINPAPQQLAAQVAGWDDAAWEAARWAIQVHGIAPLLHRSLAADPAASVLHPHLLGYLAKQYQRSSERVALLLGELAEILAACRDAGIAVLPLKGALLATHYYAEPGLRPMNDLDVLVRPSDEQRLVSVTCGEVLPHATTQKNTADVVVLSAVLPVSTAVGVRVWLPLAESAHHGHGVADVLVMVVDSLRLTV